MEYLKMIINNIMFFPRLILYSHRKLIDKYFNTEGADEKIVLVLAIIGLTIGWTWGLASLFLLIPNKEIALTLFFFSGIPLYITAQIAALIDL